MDRVARLVPNLQGLANRQVFSGKKIFLEINGEW